MARDKLIQVRRDTAANWTSVNPVLESGEAGYETDTKKLKYGDGATAWNSLSYFETVPGGDDTEVQFNDSGSFEGDENFTWDNTNKSLTLGVDGVSGGDFNVFAANNSFGDRVNMFFDSTLGNFSAGLNCKFEGIAEGAIALGASGISPNYDVIANYFANIAMCGHSLGERTIQIGYGGKVSGLRAIGIGEFVNITGSRNIGIGGIIESHVDNAVTIGIGGSNSNYPLQNTVPSSILLASRDASAVIPQQNFLQCEWNKGVRIGATSGETQTMTGQDLYVAGHAEVDGLIYADGGIDSRSNKIINLADGTLSTDAINKGQLDTTVSGYVPYTGATNDVDLGANDLTCTDLTTGVNVKIGETITLVGQSKMSIAENNNGISGVTMGNLSTGASADFRFMLRDTLGGYMAFNMPSVNNNLAIFGQTRSTLASLFLVGNAENPRDLAIGNFRDNDLFFGTSNQERMRIKNNGHIYFTNDNLKTYWGTVQDASIYYDGTDLNINPKEVGSGILDVQGTIQTEGYNSSDGSSGVSGSFTTTDGKTITVKDGLVTSIV